MPHYALLLRGVNVGTRNSLPMAELRAMLARIGCADVRTYVQSGNAVLGTTLSASKLTDAIEGELERVLEALIALGVLVVSGLLASLMPAAKAAAVNPIVALQDE